MFVLIIVNFILIISFFFTSQYIGVLDLQTIAQKEAGIILGICIASSIVCASANSII